MHKPLIYIIFTALMLGGLGQVAGDELVYSPPIQDASWVAQGNVLKCSLSQTIPRFGKAEFDSYAGGRMTLSYVMQREYPLSNVHAVLMVEPPVWRTDYPARQLATTSLRPNPKAVVFERNVALRALYELEKGMSPTLSFRDLADQHDKLVISINSVNLKTALQSFYSCTGNLHPDSFSDVHFRSIWFNSDQIQLDAKYREDLDRMLSYARVDKSVNYILLKGYADDVGTPTYNEELSQMRVNAVRDYLVQHGFDEDKIAMVYFGERHPTYSNNTAKGRALNRRVDVQLERR